MFQSSPYFRLALLMCLFTSLWFALGGTLKVLAAHSSGKTIEMVVCSGSGVKKIYVQLAGSNAAHSEVAVKHCSNTPLALASEAFNTLKYLAYAAPTTPATWQWLDGMDLDRDWLRNGKPPPGRAPPTILPA